MSVRFQTKMFTPWHSSRLSEEEMEYLQSAIEDKRGVRNMNPALAGNISKSETINDKDNWFYETVLKSLTEKLFYRDWDHYSKYYVENERPLPEFELDNFWVNYQKQYEFNPVHAHSGLFSFVIFVKIPTHWEEQHALSFSAHSNESSASDFQFVGFENGGVRLMNFPLCSQDEGRVLFFPASLYHQVYPFYGTEEERITVSGNIFVKGEVTNKIKTLEDLKDDPLEEREEMLKKMEESTELFRKSLEEDKKAGEKEGSN